MSLLIHTELLLDVFKLLVPIFHVLLISTFSSSRCQNVQCRARQGYRLLHFKNLSAKNNASSIYLWTQKCQNQLEKPACWLKTEAFILVWEDIRLYEEHLLPVRGKTSIADSEGKAKGCLSQLTRRVQHNKIWSAFAGRRPKGSRLRSWGVLPPWACAEAASSSAKLSLAACAWKQSLSSQGSLPCPCGQCSWRPLRILNHLPDVCPPRQNTFHGDLRRLRLQTAFHHR